MPAFEEYERLLHEAHEHVEHLANSLPPINADRLRSGQSDDQRMALIVKLSKALADVMNGRVVLEEPPQSFYAWLSAQPVPLTLGEVETTIRRAFETGASVQIFERSFYANALWEIYGILGFDRDGNDSPEAFISGAGALRFAQRMVDAAKEARKDHDDALSEEFVSLTGPERFERVGKAFQITFENGDHLEVLGNEARWAEKKSEVPGAETD